MQKLVHQIVFNDSGQPLIQGYSEKASRTVQNAFDFCDYKLWGMDDAEEFIKSNFEPSVYSAFRCLKPYSYKADLFKYCLLYHYGGWYVDIGVRILKPRAIKQIKPEEFVVFRGTAGWDAPWSNSLAFLYAAAGSKVFLTALDEVIENCRQRNYGQNPLSPTMSAFGRALAIHNVTLGVRSGLVVDVKEKAYKRAYALKPFGLIAARKPKTMEAGDVKNLGIEGTNDYVEMWRARDIYNDFDGNSM